MGNPVILSSDCGCMGVRVSLADGVVGLFVVLLLLSVLLFIVLGVRFDGGVFVGGSSSFSNDRKIGSRQATIFFIAFGNLPKASVDFTEARAILREIPEDASVRKPPLKKKKRGGNGH